MAKVSSKDAIILIGGYVLSPDITSYEVSEGAPPVDVTCFTDGAQNYIPGLFSAAISAQALWNNETGRAYPILKAAAGSTSDGSITILPEGGTAGGPSLSLPFTEGGISPSGQPGSAITLGSINFSSYGDNEGIENGFILHHGAVTDSTTNDSVLDPLNIALTTRCAATLHVWGVPTDTYEVKVQDSTNDVDWDDLITFSADGSALLSERQEVASGTLNKYRRVVATRTGAVGDAFSFTVHFWRDPVATT